MSKKVRIEIRLDENKDRDMIEFIDKFGSTRAGFIKQVLKMYKNEMETQQITKNYNKTINSSNEKKINTRKINDVSFSSKDF